MEKNVGAVAEATETERCAAASRSSQNQTVRACPTHIVLPDPTALFRLQLRRCFATRSRNQTARARSYYMVMRNPTSVPPGVLASTDSGHVTQRAPETRRKGLPQRMAAAHGGRSKGPDPLPVYCLAQPCPTCTVRSGHDTGHDSERAAEARPQGPASAHGGIAWRPFRRA